MRLPVTLVFPLLVSAALAALETANVYIFQEPEYSTSSTVPTLTPEEARLTIAQRLGVSRFHSLRAASNEAFAYINAFGGPQSQLFTNDGQDGRSQLVVLIDDVTPELAVRCEKHWAPIKPAFKISNPPSRAANLQLVQDLNEQSQLARVRANCTIRDNINPFNEECWPSRFKILHFRAKSSDNAISAILGATATMIAYVKSEAMDVMIILMPESSRRSSHQYGFYDMPARFLNGRSVQSEEPIEDSEASSSHELNDFSIGQDKKLVKSALKFSTCYSKHEYCQIETKNCSGHGECVAKYISETPDESCFTCRCKPSVIDVMRGEKRVEQITYWGGAACQKEDISSPFWLLVGVSVVLMGAVTAGIGMLFSIGGEKLPSVIGAGVSGPRAR